MNKIILIIIATFALVNTSYSQSEEQFKATSGITTEVGFTPFQTQGPIIQLNNLNVRWFFKSDYALRLGITANISTQDSESANIVPSVSTDYLGYQIRLNPGIEKHFKGTDRLSPYIGAELIFQRYSFNYQIEYDEITPIEISFNEIISGKSDERKFTNLSAGIGLFAGTDFYISKNLYMGAEFSYNFQNAFPSKSTRKIDGKEVDYIDGKASGFSLGTSSRGMIRLGWKF